MKYENQKHKIKSLWKKSKDNKNNLDSLESLQKDFNKITVNGKKISTTYESDWLELTSEDFLEGDDNIYYAHQNDALSRVAYNFYVDLNISESLLPFVEISMIGKSIGNSNLLFVPDTGNSLKRYRRNREEIYGDGVLLFYNWRKYPLDALGRVGSTYPSYLMGDGGITVEANYAKHVGFDGTYYYFYWTNAKTHKLYWYPAGTLHFWTKTDTNPLTEADAPYSQIVERWNYPIKTITLTDKQYNDWNFSQLPSKKDYTRDHFFQFSYGKLCSHFFIKIDENKYRLFIKGNFLVKGRGTRVIETGEDVGTYERIYTPVVDMAMPGLWHLYYTLSSETTPATQWSYYIGGEEDDDIVRAKVKYLINIRNPNIYHEIRKFKT